MPKIKIKTHSGAKKRFSLTKTGKVKRAHDQEASPAQRPRQDHQAQAGSARHGAYADKTNEAAIKRMILYK